MILTLLFTKKKENLQKKSGADHSFELIALEWHTKNLSKWTPAHANRILTRFQKDIFPWLGKRSISSIKAPDLLSALERIEKRGAIETAHRTLQNCSQVFRYAVITGRAESDISINLRGALKPINKSNHASITEVDSIGSLLRSIEGYEGHFVT